MLTQYLEAVRQADFRISSGRLTKVSSLVLEACGIRGFVGELCRIESRNKASGSCMAEIVGLREHTTLLMPYGDTHGIDLESEVIATNSSVSIQVGDGLLGRIIDPFGKPLDSQPLNKVGEQISLRGVCHNPLTRKRISKVMETGVRAIDTFLPIGRGQRIGIFSGSGVGKSTLLGMIARHASSDVNVIALIGERGREVGDFLAKSLGPNGLSRSVVVAATSDQPALVRELAAHTATAIAEHFCAQGKEVLLIMDSVTRFAMAHREIGLSVGEPATARGYTPSAFGALPKLTERAGNFDGRGSITGIYTVLVEGDDLHEPVSDHMRAILDGHIVLSRELANHGHFPAIDMLASTSRVASDLWTEDEKEIIKKALRMLSVRAKHLDMIEIGAYKSGLNGELDQVVSLYPEIEKFLVQGANETQPREQILLNIKNLISGKLN
ncbi:MAG TPA: FliI/YscN family ATPase [Methylobacter sp.]